MRLEERRERRRVGFVVAARAERREALLEARDARGPRRRADEQEQVEPPRPDDGRVERVQAIRRDEEHGPLRAPQVVDLREHGRRQHARLHADARRVSIQAELLDLVEEDDDALELLQPVEDVADARRDVRDAVLEEARRVDDHEAEAQGLGDALGRRRFGRAGRPKEHGAPGLAARAAEARRDDAVADDALQRQARRHVAVEQSFEASAVGRRRPPAAEFVQDVVVEERPDDA